MGALFGACLAGDCHGGPACAALRGPLPPCLEPLHYSHASQHTTHGPGLITVRGRTTRHDRRLYRRPARMGDTHTTPLEAEPMHDISARRRVVIGRNIILTMGAMYALRQSIYYATIGPDSLSGAQEIITADGKALGIWSALWGLVLVFCVADMVNRHTRHGLSVLVGITFAWGAGYLIIWGFTGFQDFTLVNAAVGWLAPAVFIFGFLLKVNALQDMLHAKGIEQ